MTDQKMQTPLLGGMPTAKKIENKERVLEDVWVSVGKRVYAEIDIIILFGNCLNACFYIPQAISMIPKDDDMVLNQYDFCEYGEPEKLYVQCPYLESPTFLGFVIWCTLYFVSFFVYKFIWTFEYWSNDLRFYIAYDVVNSQRVCKVFVAFGIVFTIVAGITGLGFAAHNGSSDSVGGILSFVFVNFYTFGQMWGSRFQDKNMMDLFPNEIMIHLPIANAYNFDGITLSHTAVYNYIYEIVIATVLFGDDDESRLKAIGDPNQLKQALGTLNSKLLK